jgi:iron(III) transport system ATP-binding protein
VGAARGALKAGDAATGIIRLEGTRIADRAGDNRLRTEVGTGMFLGDRKEQLFRLGALRLRRCGNLPTGSSESFIELPPDDLWIFAGDGA